MDANGSRPSRTPMMIAIVILIIGLIALVVIFALPPRVPTPTATPVITAAP